MGDSLPDFAAVAPAPRPNSVTPSEKPCSTEPPPGKNPPGGGGNQARPKTTLGAKPAKRSRDRTPTFRFRSDKSGSFECRIDRGRFRRCRSPFTAKMLAPGGHLFAVRARDTDGSIDNSPATYGFTVLR